MKIVAAISVWMLFNFIVLPITAQNGFTNKVEAKNEYKNSLKQGKWIEYADALYRPSDSSGIMTTYYRLSIYEGGKENGIVRYYNMRTNVLYSEVPYSNGKKEGVAKEYAADGKIFHILPYVNDRENGIDKIFFANNMPSLEMPVVNDSLEGILKRYYVNGNIQSEEQFAHDKLNGITRTYKENGSLESETPYVNNKIQGIKKTYYANGNLWWEASYDSGNKGLQKEYDTTGKPISEIDITNSGEVRFDWMAIDSILIKKLLRINIKVPAEVEKAFSVKNIPAYAIDSLGFGWRMLRGANLGQGGYMTINADFYYYKDSLISYTLYPGITNDTRFVEKYMQWYYPYFAKLDTIKYEQWGEVEGKIIVHPFIFNEAIISYPLNEYITIKKKKKPVFSEKLLSLMSPACGIYYGWGGGYPPGIFTNRKLFNEIENSLTDEEITALLYSINPASRLMAIEHCIKTNNPLIENERIKKWITTVYKEVPKMHTMSGCIGKYEDSEKLVEMYSKKK